MCAQVVRWAMAHTQLVEWAAHLIITAQQGMVMVTGPRRQAPTLL